MKCPQCDKLMQLKRDKENQESYIYECEECGIIQSPKLVLLYKSNDKLKHKVEKLE